MGGSIAWRWLVFEEILIIVAVSKFKYIRFFKYLFIYLLNSLKSINIDFNNNTEKKVLIQQDLEGHERLY